MTLAEYLIKYRLKRVAFARRLGVSPSIITHWCRGTRFPRAAYAAKIERATKGEVRALSFIGKWACEGYDWRCRVKRALYMSGRDSVWLAAQLNVPYSTVASALNPSGHCSRELAIRIGRATKVAI